MLNKLLGTAGLGLLVAGSLALPALAGPCTEQISELGKMMEKNSAMGPTTTGVVSGSNDDSAPQPATPQAMGAPSTQPRASAEGGTKEISGASSQVATSAQDVRLQQQGKPLTAQGGREDATDLKMSQAKTALEKARKLDQSNDSACMQAVDEVKQLTSAQ